MTSQELERRLLGAILTDATTLDECREIVSADDFQTDALRVTYSRMLQLHAAGQPVTLVDVVNLSRNDGAPAADLVEAMRIAIPDDGPAAARVIRERSISREIRRIAHAAETEAALDGADPFAILRTLEERLDQISRRQTPGRARSIAQLLPDSLESIRRAVELYAAGETVPGVVTGFVSLDRRFGGWQNSDLVVLAARPSMGKTSLALQLAEAAAADAVPTLFVSLEMGARQLLARLYSARTAYPVEDIIRGRIFPAEVDRIVAAAEEIAALPLHIDDGDSVQLEDIVTRIRRAVREKGVGLVVVDYLQLIQAKADNRAAEIDKIARGMKNLAKSLNIPIILLSQLNRELSKRASKRPQLSDLKESGGIEEAADAVVFIHRPHYYDSDSCQFDDASGVPHPTDYTEIVTAKHRNGPTGIDALSWIPGRTMFANPFEAEERERPADRIERADTDGPF